MIDCQADCVGILIGEGASTGGDCAATASVGIAAGGWPKPCCCGVGITRGAVAGNVCHCVAEGVPARGLPSTGDACGPAAIAGVDIEAWARPAGGAASTGEATAGAGAGATAACFSNTAMRCWAARSWSLREACAVKAGDKVGGDDAGAISAADKAGGGFTDTVGNEPAASAATFKLSAG